MKRNNPWFITCGILEILFAIGYVVIALLMFWLLLFASAIGSISESGSNVAIPFWIYLILALLAIVVSIFLACVFFIHRKKSYEQLHQKPALIITSIVLSFIFGAIFIGIFALLGYLQKDTPNEVTTPQLDQQEEIKQSEEENQEQTKE